jgi:hypothetical protein
MDPSFWLITPNGVLMSVYAIPSSGHPATRSDFHLARELREAARSIKRSIRVANVDAKSNVEDAITSLHQQGIDGLFIANDPYTSLRSKIIELAIVCPGCTSRVITPLPVV